MTIAAAGRRRPMTRELQPGVIARARTCRSPPGPFNAHLVARLPAGCRAHRLRARPDAIVLDDSWAATESTYVQFQGRTAYGERSRIPFHVTSLDWQESDRVLAGIMTDFGAPTGAVPIDGNGEFDGVMLASFSQAAHRGAVHGRGCAPGTWSGAAAPPTWSSRTATPTSRTRVTPGGSEIRADGKFSLGYPAQGRRRGDRRARPADPPALDDLRHAFELDDYPVEGLVSGEFHLYGRTSARSGSAS